jgi:hypothetical protein
MQKYEQYYDFFLKYFDENCKNTTDVFTEGKKMLKALHSAMHHVAQAKGE